MYRYLWSNGPKEALEFADYSFVEHFGKPITSYPPRTMLLDYIEGRATKAGIHDWIRFSTLVKFIRFNESSSLFKLTVYDLKNDIMYDEMFDHVIIATGHFSVPNVPEFPGFSSFEGRILHAHDFRSAIEFRDKDVLIIGSSSSAEDIGLQCWKYGAKSITVSYRSAPMGYNWPSNWFEVPLLDRVEGRMAYFKDNSSKTVDAIILCTGYKHHFPFLPDDLRLKTDNRLAINNLYKGVAWVNNTRLFYLGMQDQWFSFTMFDAQAWWIRDVILGKIVIPTDKVALLEDVAARVAQEDSCRHMHEAIQNEGDYLKELLNETDCPSFDVDVVLKILYAWEDHRKTDILSYRDHAFESVVTRTMAAVHHTPWKEAYEDPI